MLSWSMLACRLAPDLDPAFERADVSSLALSAPPMLDVGPVTGGIDVRFRVRNVLPLENVYVSWSSQGPGERCFERLSGACLDLRAPRGLYGPVSADLSGEATYVHRFANTPAVDKLWAQGVVYRLDGTVETTPVVIRAIVDPADVLEGDVIVADAVDLSVLAGITAITGSLRIEGTALTEVELPDLEQIGQDLVIWENGVLSTLSLPGLRQVGGALSLYDNPQLDSLAGLSSLREVGAELSVNRMEGLLTLSGLEGLQTVGGRVYLFHDTELDTLSGLSGLEIVGGTVQLWELYALTEAVLPGLHTIGGRLDLFEDDALVTLSMPKLRRVAGIEVHHCDALTDVGSFPELQSTGDVTLLYDDALAAVTGLCALRSIELLSIRIMPMLSSLAGLCSLAEVEGELSVSVAPSLVSLDLPALSSAGSLEIDSNTGLLEIGLPALSEVDDDVVVKDNPALSQCGFESWLSGITLGGIVSCVGNLDDGCSSVCLLDTGP